MPRPWAGRTAGWLEPSEEEGEESELKLASWACLYVSCVPASNTHPPPPSPQLGKEKGSVGRERELPLNPEFASSVALGKVLSFSEPQFLHLSNGLVIPFLSGCHAGT